MLLGGSSWPCDVRQIQLKLPVAHNVTDGLRLRRAAVTLDVPGVRRDASALVAKLLPVVTPLLTGKSRRVAYCSGKGNMTHVCLMLAAFMPLGCHPSNLRGCCAGVVQREQHKSLASIALALAAALRAVPAAFRQHVGALDAFFAALVSSSAGLPANLRARACECFALLPRAAGDGAAWSALAQRLLHGVHAALDAAFQGLDDPALAAAAKCARWSCIARRFCIDSKQPTVAHTCRMSSRVGWVVTACTSSVSPQPQVHPGRIPQLPVVVEIERLSCDSFLLGLRGTLNQGWLHSLARRSALQPDVPALGPVRGPSEGLAQAAALLETLERLLTAPFPAPVPLPAGGLLLMLTRILSMDDVAHSSGAVHVSLAPGVWLSDKQTPCSGFDSSHMTPVAQACRTIQMLPVAAHALTSCAAVSRAVSPF